MARQETILGKSMANGKLASGAQKTQNLNVNKNFLKNNNNNNNKNRKGKILNYVKQIKRKEQTATKSITISIKLLQKESDWGKKSIITILSKML